MLQEYRNIAIPFGYMHQNPENLLVSCSELFENPVTSEYSARMLTVTAHVTFRGDRGKGVGGRWKEGPLPANWLI